MLGFPFLYVHSLCKKALCGAPPCCRHYQRRLTRSTGPLRRPGLSNTPLYIEQWSRWPLEVQRRAQADVLGLIRRRVLCFTAVTSPGSLSIFEVWCGNSTRTWNSHHGPAATVAASRGRARLYLRTGDSVYFTHRQAEPVSNRLDVGSWATIVGGSRVCRSAGSIVAEEPRKTRATM